MHYEDEPVDEPNFKESLAFRTQRIANHLLDKYGPVVSRADLVRVLGFASPAALERACQRGQLNLPFLKPPNRRGVCADAWDVAKYLAEILREVPGPEREVDG